ncbi:hypothetical protein G9A89_002339 [Geosiphon pyriformis]|nr:hypothetical protein G9A89_002339 [Geosiphon pyriformis]
MKKKGVPQEVLVRLMEEDPHGNESIKRQFPLKNERFFKFRKLPVFVKTGSEPFEKFQDKRDLVKVAINDMGDPIKNSPPKILVEDPIKLDFLRRIAHIANTPYCTDFNEIGKDENGERHPGFRGDAVIDEASLDVVAFFRGTSDIKKTYAFTKWGNDLAMVEQSWYSVINKQIIWTKTIDVIAEKIINIKKNDINVIFTGHGVGGAYAILLAMKILTTSTLFNELKQKSGKSSIKFKAITFGQPRVGNFPFARLVNGALEVYRITNENDPFVHLPKKIKGQRFGHHEREYWITENNCECRTIESETDTFKLYECPSFTGDVSLNADESSECSLSTDTSHEDAHLNHWGPYLGFVYFSSARILSPWINLRIMFSYFVASILASSFWSRQHTEENLTVYIRFAASGLIGFKFFKQIPLMSLKNDKSFISTTYHRNLSANDSNSVEKTNLSGKPLSKSLEANFIEDSWNDIDSYIHEPGLFSFESATSRFTLKDPKFMHKLISGAIARKRTEEDLLPSILAKKTCEMYEHLDKEGKLLFIKVLVSDFGNRPIILLMTEESLKAAQTYISTLNDDKSVQANLRAAQILRHILVPLYHTFFNRVNLLPEGTKFLMNIRSDVLNFLQEKDDIYLSEVNETLRRKLKGLLVGFLELERVTWNSPAVLLEKIIYLHNFIINDARIYISDVQIKNYERVHPIKDWKDLKRLSLEFYELDLVEYFIHEHFQIAYSRRIFAYYYRPIPNEPLVFLQVALTKNLVENVQSILNHHILYSAEEVQCAIFYSITSQPGLTGIQLGNFLIKRVVIELQTEFPNIHTFSTISPIPGFRRWLEETLNIEGSNIFLLGEKTNLKILLSESPCFSANIDLANNIKNFLSTNDWGQDKNTIEILKPILLRLCARYILSEKRNALALDPVANFHIRNGACVHQLNWLGDMSDKGFQQSFGIMANYNYILPHIEENTKRYLRDGSIRLSSNDPFLIEEAQRTSSNIQRIS